jgi:hypothetical protein
MNADQSHYFRYRVLYAHLLKTHNIFKGHNSEIKIKLSSNDMKGATCEPSVARRRRDARSAPASFIPHVSHLYCPCLPDFISLWFPKFRVCLFLCALFSSPFVFPSSPSLFLCTFFLPSLPFHYSVQEWLLTAKFCLQLTRIYYLQSNL